MSFAACSLEGTTKNSKFNAASVSLQRLATIGGVPLHDLVPQFKDIRGFAVHRYSSSTTKLASYECWRESVERANGRNKQNHPNEEFEKCFVVLPAWGACDADFGDALLSHEICRMGCASSVYQTDYAGIGFPPLEE